MKEKSSSETDQTDQPPSQREPHVVRLPGFISDDDIGLGDAVTRATSALGIKPCGGCRRRAATLNRWLVFSGRGSR
jgi:hypothetical protein